MTDERGPCPRCGESIPLAARECRFCGLDLIAHDSEPVAGLRGGPGPATSPRPKNPPPFALFVVAILVVAGFMVFLSNSLGDESGGERSDACQAVPRSALDDIEEGLTVSGGALSNGHAVQIGDWWFVAAQINAPGLEGSVGVWAMPDYRDPGPIYMANAIAREFSQWGTQVGSENAGVWQRGSAAADCLS